MKPIWIGLLALLALSDSPRASAQGGADDWAQTSWKSGRRREAIAIATSQLEEDASNVELRARLVGWELQVGHFETALSHMADDDPRRGIALYTLARFEEALAVLDAENPEHVEARMESLLALGRLEEADALLETALALLGPGDVRVLYWSGQSLVRAGDLETAAVRFRHVLELDPIHQAARFALGRALLASGAEEDGRAVLARHRELVPLIDRYEFALQGLDLDPTHAPNRAALAEIEAGLGLLERAAASFTLAAALAKDGEHTPIALRHARFYEQLHGDPEQAVGVLDQAMERGADVRCLVRAADILERAGYLEGALERLERAKAQRPTDAAIEARRAKVAAALETPR